MPSATYSHTAVARIDHSSLWDRLQIAETWAFIGPVESVWDARHSGDALERFSWRTTVGPTSYDGTAVVSRSVRPSGMTLDLDAGELAGTLAADLEGIDDQTKLVVTMTVESRGMLSALFFPAISKAVGDGFGRQIDEFVGGLTFNPD